MMDAIVSQITSLTIVYSTAYSDADQSKHQSSASLAFVRGIHRGPVNSPHKWPVTRKMFPFDDVIMKFMARLFSYTKWAPEITVLIKIIYLNLQGLSIYSEMILKWNSDIHSQQYKYATIKISIKTGLIRIWISNRNSCSFNFATMLYFANLESCVRDFKGMSLWRLALKRRDTSAFY